MCIRDRCEPVIGPGGSPVGQLGAAGHPDPATRVSPSTPNRARFVAAASNEKSADFGLAADSGPHAAVPAAHQVPEFAFDLWSGGPVLGLPGRILLGGAGPGQLGLVATNTDGAPGPV